MGVNHVICLKYNQSTSQLWLKHGTNSFMTAAVCYISADIQNVIGNHSSQESCVLWFGN